MIISFSLENQSYQLDLSLHAYEELIKIVHETIDEDHLSSFCKTHKVDMLLCQKFITYERVQKMLTESVPVELDASCDYDDHL